MNMVNQLHERTTITISKETYEKLRKLGVYGDSMDDVVNRVLQQVKEDSRK
jgi:predicted CopG family antitoxin